MVLKHAAGFTECGSANDRSQLFKNTKLNQKKESCELINTALKQEATRLFQVCTNRGELKVSGSKFETIIDCIATNNIINDKLCKSRKTIQDGFLSTGEISKTSDGVGINSCPDLYTMVQTTKNRKVKNDFAAVARSLFPIAKMYAANGSLSEHFFDNHKDENGKHIFPMDEIPNGCGKVKVKKFTDGQYHLMRTMLPYHASFVSKENIKREMLHNKREQAIKKKHRDCLDLLAMNREAEKKLCKQTDDNLRTCTPKHLYALTKPLLKGFISVRITQNLYDKRLKEIQKLKKGKCTDLDYENSTAQTDGISVDNAFLYITEPDSTLLKLAYKLRFNPVIAQPPPEPQLPQRVDAPIPIPTVYASVHQIGSFEPKEEWITLVCESIANCSDRQSDFKTHWVNRVDDLKDPLLGKILHARLISHLNKFPKVNASDEAWQFMINNLPHMAGIVKMLEYVRDDETLKSTETTETLFSPHFITNHELLLETCADQHGAYLVFDSRRGTMLRAGSASNKFGHRNKKGSERGRYNGHEAASMQQSNSVFYNSYPHKDSPHKINGVQKGVFQQLEFIPAIRFKNDDKINVQKLFSWNDAVLSFLEKRNPAGCKTLEDKKHRLVCYLFETTLQLCLSPQDNLSQNPGCESFVMAWSEGYENIDLDDYTGDGGGNNNPSGD